MMRLTATLSVVLSLSLTAACGSSSSGGDDGEPDPGVDAGGADASDAPVVCIPRTDDNPDGLKDIKYVDSTETVYPQSNWRIALEPSTEIGWATFSGAAELEAAMLFDLPEPGVEVAGFLVSREATRETAEGEAILAQTVLGTAVPSISRLSNRLSGTRITSLDGYDTVVSTTVEVTTSTTMDAVELRQAIIPALLGRTPDQVSFTESGWQGGRTRSFVLTMQTLYRADADQTLFVGAIGRTLDVDDRHRKTGLHVDDLANGSGVTVSANGEARECEDEVLEKQALADIIWIIDESGSTSGERDNIAANAVAFFDKALDLGLDFRMGVTDMNDGSMGMFASRDEAAGAGERWLLPDEPDLFAAAINDPSGPASADGGSEHGLTQLQAVLERHLPRDAGDEFNIRPEAKVAVVIMTDEKPQEVKVADLLGSGNKEPTSEQHAALMAYLQPYLELLTTENIVVHLIAEPLPFETTPCAGTGAEHAFGYYELASATGGQLGSICQANLDSTLDVMLDSVVGDASPLELEYVPISASITVMRDGVPVPRSREVGWDYRSASNSVVFYGMAPITPANPAEIVVAYRRWEQQVIE